MPEEDFKEVEEGKQKESEEDERPDAVLGREEDAVEELDANLSRDSTISSKTT